MTTTKAKLFDRNGNQIEDHGRPLKDGERRSFPMSMMDAAHDALLRGQTVADTVTIRHSPGYAVPPMTDAEIVNSEATMAFRKQNLSQAWMKPSPKPVTPPLAKKDETPATDVESLLQARDARLTEAWRTPPAALPALSATDTSTSPVMPDVAAAIAARDARLENAWRAA